MKADRLERLKRLLFEAADLSEDEREAFLGERCKGDPELRREIERLLEYDEDRLEVLKTRGALSLLPGVLPDPPDMIGRTLSHYRIEEKITRGGMGDLYKAVDLLLQRHVAVKVLRPDLIMHPAGRERFMREARAASALNHPGIVTVHDVGTESGIDYIVMEYVDGCPLRDLIRPGGLPPDAVISYALSLAESLQAAHTSGVVHRDLKPSNIMITEGGGVKILDFGISKRLGTAAGKDASAPAENGLTRTGDLIGTIDYMSPEQVEGKRIDHRSDLFSLGGVIYEMITGRKPFHRNSAAATLHAILHDDPDPPARYRPDVPEDLQGIVLKALTKRKTDRYRSAEQLAEDLRRIGAGQGVKYASSFRSLQRQTVRSLAILYLKNLGAEEDEHLSYGITEDLIVDMTRIGTLHVSPMHSILEHRDSNAGLEEIARELDVKFIFEGSIRRRGGSVRVSAQLVDIETGKNLWADRWEEPFDNLPAIKKSLVEGLSQALDVGTTAVKSAQAGIPEAQDPCAYEYYLRGKYTFEHKKDVSDLDVALGLYRRALEIEPSLLAARMGVARIWIYRADYDRAERELMSTLSAAREGVSKADEANVLRLLAGVYNNRSQFNEAWKFGDQALRIVREAGDMAGEGQVLGLLVDVLQRQARFADALRCSRRVLEINRQLDDWTQQVDVLRIMGTLHWHMGEHDRAMDHLREALEIARRQKKVALEADCIADTAVVFMEMDRLDEALRCFDRAMKIYDRLDDQGGRVVLYSNIAVVHQKRGEYRKALRLFRKASRAFGRLGDEESYAISSANAAGILAILGEYGRATRLARKALTIGKKVASPRIIAHTDQLLGNIHLYNDRPERARECYLEALDLARQAGLHGEAASLVADLNELFHFHPQAAGDPGLSKATPAELQKAGGNEARLKTSAYSASRKVRGGDAWNGILELRRILEQANALGDPRFVLITRRLLGEALLEQGPADKDRREGLAILRETLEIARRTEVAHEVKWIGEVLH